MGAVEKVVDAVVNYGFDRLADPAVDGVIAFWHTADDPLGMDHTARVLDEANRLIHKEVLGDPAEAIIEKTGSLLPRVFGDIASEAGLPSDGAYVLLRRAANVIGIVSGVASGQPLLAVACFKNLAVDELKRAAINAIRDAITEPLRRHADDGVERPRRQPPDIVELTELAREFQQIQASSLVLAVKDRWTMRYDELELGMQARSGDAPALAAFQAKSTPQPKPNPPVKRHTK